MLKSAVKSGGGRRCSGIRCSFCSARLAKRRAVSFAGAPGAGRCLAIGSVSCTSVHPPIAASSFTGASRTTCLDSRVANLKAVMHQRNGRQALKQLDSQDVAGAHEDRAPRRRPKSSRGGQSSRARRLQKFQEASAVCAQGMVLLHRANLREATLATCAHSECSRETARQLLACRRHTRRLGQPRLRAWRVRLVVGEPLRLRFRTTART